MAHIVADFVEDTTITTGTGAKTLAGAINGRRAIGDVCANGDTIDLSIFRLSGAEILEWETGRYTYATSGDTITAAEIYASSNSNNAVSFGAGTKYVVGAPLASRLGGSQSGFASQAVPGGRLTLESGVPVSTSDQTGKATLYYTPYAGNEIALYRLGAWRIRSFAETSLSLSGYTSGKPYDIFGYDNSGTFALESLVWTNDTTRATALTRLDGVLVKSGDSTRRYLGTIYTSGTGTTEDSLTKRYVWNMYNRCDLPMRRYEPADSWSYPTVTTRQANGNTANQLDFVRGLDEDACDFWTYAEASITTAGNIVLSGVGIDSTTLFGSSIGNIIAQGYGSVAADFVQMHGRYTGLPGVGKHRAVWLERGAASGTTFYGDSGGSGTCGILGRVRA